MPEFPSFDRLPDREKLREYVLWVRALLGELVAQRNHEKFFYSRTVVDMRDAWLEVQPEFDRLLAAVENLDDAVILSHGLGGFQLKFKLAVVRELFLSFRRPSGQGLRRLLGGVDALLDSIVAAAGGGSAVKEIKDTIRSAIKADPAG